MLYLVETEKNVILLRNARGLSQEQAALEAGISPGRWQQLEKGSKNTTLDTLRRMAKVVHVAPQVMGVLSLSDGEILALHRQLPPLPSGTRPGTVGQNVTLLRKIRGLSQKELAKRAHVSAARLRDMELGCANVTVGFLERVATGLGVPLLALGTVGFSEDQVLDMVHSARAIVKEYQDRKRKKSTAGSR
ncbi:MAG: helix-turn-helix transcriptional regulator [Oscillospiraceae bacterium]|jgi:transcriptional regulator with XRE-family HTH domain|nr:helix-turn-helix transcriptional regulator [Oscillospiraceae bacterium]